MSYKTTIVIYQGDDQLEISFDTYEHLEDIRHMGIASSVRLSLIDENGDEYYMRSHETSPSNVNIPNPSALSFDKLLAAARQSK